MSAFVLLHSPLTTAAVWGPLPGALLNRGWTVATPQITDDARPPFAVRYVAGARSAAKRHDLGRRAGSKAPVCREFW